MSNGGHPSKWARMTVATLAAGAVLAFGSQAHAVEAIVVAPDSVAGGATITVSGSDWTCNGDIEIFLAPEGGAGIMVETVPFTDHADGTFVIEFIVPIDPGDYGIIATYAASATSAGCLAEASSPFTVLTSPSTTTASTTIAPTTTSAPTTTDPGTTTTTLSSDSGATTTTLSGSSGATTTTTDPGTTTTALSGDSGATTSTGPSGRLPVTGGSSFDFVPYAILLASFGGLLVLAARRDPA